MRRRGNVPERQWRCLNRDASPDAGRTVPGGAETPARSHRVCATLNAVQHAFGTVLWVVCVVGLVIGVFCLIASRTTWEHYGKSLLLLDSDLQSGPAMGSPAAIRERDAEIREMLHARNARRMRRGEPPIDVEEELARLTAPQVDPALHAEIRDLVIARNNRRARAGKPPLDVDAEVQREISKLGEL